MTWIFEFSSLSITLIEFGKGLASTISNSTEMLLDNTDNSSGSNINFWDHEDSTSYMPLAKMM